MKSSIIIRKALARYKENELIFANKLYREELFQYLHEAAYYKMLERMCKNGELAKVAKGIYYIPLVSKYGVVPLSEKQIIEAYTKNHSGVVIGYAMYNHLKLTTQVPKTINVVSSALEGASKKVRNVTIKQVDIEYSVDIENMICGLEVLQNFYEIEDVDYVEFVNYSRKLALSFHEKIFETVISKMKYKKSTISFLREILNYYGVPNNLEKHLSSLSEYKHPKMEEIYELAQICGGF